MSKIIVIGHKNPDTDSVVSAMTLSYLLQQEGVEAVPAVTGNLNKETEYILSFLKEESPEKMKELGEEKVFLVDHNELAQSIAKRENICGVVDHHQISGLKTDIPIFFRVEPLGSTSTLIYKMIKERGAKLEKKEAALLLAGIISDTLNLVSSTTTEEDKNALSELSEIAEIDVDDFAENMFKAKSNLSGKNMDEIITEDGKEYNFEGKRIYIGWSEVTSLDFFDDHKNLLLEALIKVKEKKGVDFLFFGAVNILKSETRLYFTSETERTMALEAFQGTETEDFLFLPNVTSRKKQVVPPISEIISKS